MISAPSPVVTRHPPIPPPRRVESRGQGLRLTVIALVATLILMPPAESFAATVTFCTPAIVPPGGNFVSYNGIYSGALPAGRYRMSASQSGTFAINNLLVTWNGLSIGTLQDIAGSSRVYFSGNLPPNAPRGQTATVTLRIHDASGQEVDTSTTTVTVEGQNDGWRKVWTATNQSGPAGYAKHYIGDFNGDGAEDLLGVSTTWMTLFHFRNNDWEWGWTNQGNPAVGNGIFAVKDNLIVGDFDWDGKDEVLGIGAGVTLFNFDNGNWSPSWSNNGSTTDPIYQSSRNGNYLVAGNFDLSGNSGSSLANKDELVSVAVTGLVSIFRLNSNGLGWDWVWMSGSNPTASALYPYRANLRNGGDTNGDGQDELLGLSSWATLFNYRNSTFEWMWSTANATHIGGAAYPQGPNDVWLAGNIDHVDAKDEWFFIQNGPTADWAVTEDFEAGQPTWNWSNHNFSPSSASIGDWPLTSVGGSLARYQLIRTVAGQPKLLIARRTVCQNTDMGLYAMSNVFADY